MFLALILFYGVANWAGQLIAATVDLHYNSNYGMRYPVDIIENMNNVAAEFSSCYVTIYIPQTHYYNLTQPIAIPIFLLTFNDTTTVHGNRRPVAINKKHCTTQKQSHLIRPRNDYSCYALFVMFPEVSKHDKVSTFEFGYIYDTGRKSVDGQIQASSLVFYYNIVTTLTHTVMKSKLKTYRSGSTNQNTFHLIHYVKPINLNQGPTDRKAVTIHFTKLIVIPYTAKLFKERDWMEFTNISNQSFIMEIKNFHRRIGLGRNYYFLYQTQNQTHFLQHKEYYKVPIVEASLLPFVKHPNVTDIEIAMHQIAFETISFLAYEPILQDELFKIYLKEFMDQTMSLEVWFQRLRNGPIFRVLTAIPTGELELSYTTTKGIQQTLDFSLYYRTYDWLSWLHIAIFAFAAVPSCACLMAMADTTLKIGTNPFILLADIQWLVYRTLLEAGYEVTAKVKSLLVKCWFRIMIGLWSLTCVVLINGYKGVVVTDLVAPIPVFSRYKTLLDINDFVVILDFDPKNVLIELIELLNNDVRERFPSCNGLTRTRYKPIAAHNVTRGFYKSWFRNASGSFPKPDNSSTTVGLRLQGYMNRLGRLHKQLMWAFDWFLLEKGCGIQHPLPQQLILAQVSFRTGPTKSTIELEDLKQVIMDYYINASLVLDKSVVFGTAETVDAVHAANELRKLEGDQTNLGATFRKSNKIHGYWNGFVFYGHKYHAQLYARVQLLLSSGIFQIWDKWIKIHHPTDDAKIVSKYQKKQQHTDSKPKRLDLNSNVLTCFCLYGVGLLIAIALLLADKIPFCQNLKKCGVLT